MYRAGLTPASFDIRCDRAAEVLLAYPLTSINLVAALEKVIRQIQIANKAIVDHNTLGTVYALHILRIYIACNMMPSFYHQDRLSRVRRLPGECRAIQAGTDDQVVIHFVSFPFFHQ